MASNSQQGGKNRKYDRNRQSCERYEREGRLAKNKARSLKRHLKRMGLPESYLGSYTTPGGKPHPHVPAKPRLA